MSHFYQVPLNHKDFEQECIYFLISSLLVELFGPVQFIILNVEILIQLKSN